MDDQSHGRSAFTMEQYNEKPPFCSFLPGLAGALGVPMWAYYVNRGQGVCSFGVENKDNAILEFFPANDCYRRVAREGFRTFIQCGEERYEPFAPGGSGKRTMGVHRNALDISDETHLLRMDVRYFILPGESFPALVRRCTLTNVIDKALEVKALDGLPQLMPFGVTTSAYKSISNLQKSWAELFGLTEGTPFFTLRTMPGDEAEVKMLGGANFSLCFTEDGTPIRPFTDPELVFGQDTTHFFPRDFPGEAPDNQVFANRYPCSLTPLAFSLEQGASASWDMLIGYASDPDAMAKRAKSLCNRQWLDAKQEEAARLTETLTDSVATKSAMPLVDDYFRQCYLDNLLRGGEPMGLGDKVIHLFSRKHGDPERDYNFFSTAAEYFSQGNGNFRDVCQNRRNDVYFHPDAGEYNIWWFYSLTQADGFNPLEVRGATFTVKPEHRAEFETLAATLRDGQPILQLFGKSFTAGAVVNTLYRENLLNDGQDAVAFTSDLLTLCKQNIEAVFGEGYWIDHWTYLQDLIDSYLSIFPDRKQNLLFGRKDYAFFESPVRIRPRKEAYVLSNGVLRQYNALEHREGRPAGGFLRIRGGEVYYTNLFAKMLSLSAVKFASLDPAGCGLEMDGGKPGWNDAMNGLPGLFGSGVGEALELLRVLRFLREVKGYGGVKLPAETAELLQAAHKALSHTDEYVRWNETATRKEQYRESILEGFGGSETEISEAELRTILGDFIQKLEHGAEKAEALGGDLIPTYLTFEPTALNEENFPLGFTVSALPAFLEGPVRQLKTHGDKAPEIYRQIKNSEIYDKELKMYRTSVSLDACGYDIGRVRAFTPGWLERESIFMHMSYKYLLELLKTGLYDEFYEEIRHSFPPFMDAAVYGRCVLENSSFIASSNNPDPRQAGRGFVSRLSGSTAEALSMWQRMFVGDPCFTTDENGGLSFRLNPILPAWLFDEEGELHATLLGKIPLIYRNPSKKNTYGKDGVAVCRLTVRTLKGVEESYEGNALSGLMAEAVRRRKIERVVAELG